MSGVDGVIKSRCAIWFVRGEKCAVFQLAASQSVVGCADCCEVRACCSMRNVCLPRNLSLALATSVGHCFIRVSCLRLHRCVAVEVVSLTTGVLRVWASLCGAAKSLLILQLSSGAHLVRRKFFGVSYARGMRETAACACVA